MPLRRSRTRSADSASDGGAPSPVEETDRRSGGSRSLEDAIDSALTVPTARIHAYVDGIRAKHPAADPEAVIRILERRYLLAVSASGGAVGAAAAIPAVGTGAALVLTAGQIGTFLAASSALALAVADVHGIAVDDAPRRRALLLTALLGEQGPQLLSEQLGVSSLAWGRTLLTRLPLATVQSVNRALRGRFVTGTVARAGSVMLGRLLPFGVGAAIGYAGSRVIGKTMIEGVRGAFGPPPPTFVRQVDATFVVADDLFAPPRLPGGQEGRSQPGPRGEES